MTECSDWKFDRIVLWPIDIVIQSLDGPVASFLGVLFLWGFVESSFYSQRPS